MTTGTENWIDRPGVFRGSCIDARITTGSNGSSSIGLDLTYKIEECLDGDQWSDWRPYDMIARGTLWIIKKDGTVNEKAAATARDVVGWDGNLDNPDPNVIRPVQFTVEPDEYNGNVRHKIAWFNPYDSTPRAKQLTPEELRQIKNQHGAKLRAFFGAKPSAAPKPSGTPSAPPPPQANKPAAQKRRRVDGESTKEACWATHLETMRNKPEAQINSTWAKALEIGGEGREEADFTPNDWANVLDIVGLPF